MRYVVDRNVVMRSMTSVREFTSAAIVFKVASIIPYQRSFYLQKSLYLGSMKKVQMSYREFSNFVMLFKGSCKENRKRD
jgi:hypothetical protein